MNSLLFISAGDVVGGHESQALGFIQELQKNNEVDVISTSLAHFNYLKSNQINSVCIPAHTLGKLHRQVIFSFGLKKIVKSLIENRSYQEIIISGGTYEAVVALTLAFYLLKIKPSIYIPMHINRGLTHGFFGRLYSFLLPKLFFFAFRIYTINRMQAFIIKRNTCNANVFIRKNTIRDVKIIAKTGVKKLAYVGRLDESQKSLIELIRWLDNPKACYRLLEIYGSGPDEELIKSFANNTSYISVNFMGWVTDSQLESNLNKNVILVMNSRWEGEPLVVREFLSRGLNVLCRDIPGFAGVVKKQFRYKNQDQFYNRLSFLYNQDVNKS